MSTRVVGAAELGEPYGSSFEHLRDELARIDLLVSGQVARARETAGDEAWRGLAISEAEVDELLQRSLGAPPWAAARSGPALAEAHAFADRLEAAIEKGVRRSVVPLKLAQLASRFALTRFDLDVLLIALAPELDLRYERLYAYLHDDLTRKRPSVDLALHLLCRSLEQRFAARARFGTSAPLIRSGLIRLIAESGAPPLLSHALKVDDRVVDWLHGATELEPRLARAARRVVPTRALAELNLTQALRQRLIDLAAELRDAPPEQASNPVLYFQGHEGVGKRSAAHAFAHALGHEVLSLDAALVATAPEDEAEWLVRAAAREARLSGDLLLCEHADLLLSVDKRRALGALMAGVDEASVPSVLTGTLAWAPPGALGARPVTRLEFGLNEACRHHSGQRLGNFARKVSARPSWAELVLPSDRVGRLREACDHARHRATVFDRWGFDGKLANGKGLGLLFSGAPGTGKTFAASVIASELGLDLFQVDLACVVSKWLGETEKNLGSIFDEAQRGRAIILFDEADAVFGKRTEVHDAHDRHANLGTSYLLQRMDEHQGIVILTSNFRRNLDEAFVRRLRFIVDFPLPDEHERLRIWQQIWPAETPLALDLNLSLLARRFDLAGAHLRNIALAASFLAAAEDQPVSLRHALHAARREYQKLGKMVDDGMFGEAR